MHKLLKKQLKKLGFKDGHFPDGNLDKFIELVNVAYKEADEERIFLEHTLETSSQEMQELFEELKQKSETELAKSEERYRKLATRDIVTGALNRYAFQEQLKRTIAHARRVNKHFALLFLDLDHFKDVNDNYGHDIGDKLLQEVAKRVLFCIREEDVLARLGGDEFVLLFTEVNGLEMKPLVNKIVTLFREPWYIGEN
ncbi:MAG TPA: GGDEF domain-containing protein, partial [Thiomicrospira sp.]|nr:GGDEF domain-containing protein [Thiomicrospira sp.]